MIQAEKANLNHEERKKRRNKLNVVYLIHTVLKITQLMLIEWKPSSD